MSVLIKALYVSHKHTLGCSFFLDDSDFPFFIFLKKEWKPKGPPDPNADELIEAAKALNGGAAPALK